MAPKNTITTTPMPYSGIMPAFNPDDFAAFIDSNGVELIHYKAIPCPVGLEDEQDSVHKNHVPHAGCSNGYIFIEAGCLVATFNNAPNLWNLGDTGLVSGSTCMVTFPFTYTDGITPVVIAVQDRFYLKDIQCYVTSQQRFQRGNGTTDFLHFPPEYIEYIFDSKGLQYLSTDYSVTQGSLLWVGNRPAEGTICAIRYLYRPFWYAARLLHEIRVARTENMVTGERGLTRMPYSALCNRENVGRNEYTQINPNQIVPPRAILPPNQRNNFLSGKSPSSISEIEEE